MTRFDIEFYDGQTEETQLIYTALDYDTRQSNLKRTSSNSNGDYLRIVATYNNTTDDDVVLVY